MTLGYQTCFNDKYIYKVISIDCDRCVRIEQHWDFNGGVKIGIHNCFNLRKILESKCIKITGKHTNYNYAIGTVTPHSKLYTFREWQYQQFME